MFINVPSKQPFVHNLCLVYASNAKLVITYISHALPLIPDEVRLICSNRGLSGESCHILPHILSAYQGIFWYHFYYFWYNTVCDRTYVLARCERSTTKPQLRLRMSKNYNAR